MDIRYEEWLPAAAGLEGLVTAYWRGDQPERAVVGPLSKALRP